MVLDLLFPARVLVQEMQTAVKGLVQEEMQLQILSAAVPTEEVPPIIVKVIIVAIDVVLIVLVCCDSLEME
ncbi:MAG: hypothetical protein M1450_01790 [Patescibacteria group bacterium]|nr:hypothetical protein [Patescibacteria group bacterium]